MGEVRKGCNRWHLATAGGLVKPDTIIRTHFDANGEDVDAIALEGSPDALALGRRCATLGYEFWWRPFHQTPVFKTPDGRVVDVVCDAFYVPFVNSFASMLPYMFSLSYFGFPVLLQYSQPDSSNIHVLIYTDLSYIHIYMYTYIFV